MQIKKDEFEAIENALMLLPCGEWFKRLNDETQTIIINADVAMVNILKRKKKSNKKTAEYIAERRKTDKNYARKKEHNND